MSSNAEILARRTAAIPRGVATSAPVFVDRAENGELWDVEGNRYIDFASGIAVTNTGHRHPKVMAAVAAQCEKFAHVAFQVTGYENYVELAERLNKAAPIADAKSIFFTTGAEATENAVKIARAYTGRQGVITFTGAFHGRTQLTMAMTGKAVPYRTRGTPPAIGVYHCPFPIPHHGVSEEQALKALYHILKADISPDQVAAIVIEPVQGEGGFYVAPKSFMQKLRAICDEYGILMIIDEVQTGFARTGTMLAIEQYDIEPDLVTMAKSLAGGFPLAAVTGRASVMDAPAPGGLGGTYGGSPIGIAAANAVIDVIEEEGLCERANLLGNRLKQRLESLRDDVPEISDIRGPGFMNAVEFADPGSKAPDAGFAGRVKDIALTKGLILLTCGIHGNVIRFLSPITIQDEVFGEALDLLEASIREARTA